MFIIEVIDGLNCPMAVCDVCNKAIDDSSLANVEFKYKSYKMRIVHKGCSYGSRDNWELWMQLDVYLDDLLHNVGYKYKNKRERRFIKLGRSEVKRPSNINN